MSRFSEFRTQRYVLEAFDQLAGGDAPRDSAIRRLSSLGDLRLVLTVSMRDAQDAPCARSPTTHLHPGNPRGRFHTATSQLRDCAV